MLIRTTRALQACKGAGSPSTDEMGTRIRLKMARNCKRRGELDAALSILNSVRVQLRTAPVWMEIGRLHAASGATRPAVKAFEEVLKANPYALAAAEELMKVRKGI